MDYSRESLADALAADYVAGTLRGQARRRLEALLPAHPVLHRAVQAWQHRLAPLTAALPLETPPEHVWHGIERRLWPPTQAAADAGRAAASAAGWWGQLRVWRGLAATLGAVAVALVVLTVQTPPAEAPVVVVLQQVPGQAAAALAPAIVASLSADGRALTTRPLQPVHLQADRALELWAVPVSGAPRSLGTIAPEGMSVVSRHRLTSSLLQGDVATLAVTIEPAGGSPTGAPTGPIVYAGQLKL